MGRYFSPQDGNDKYNLLSKNHLFILLHVEWRYLKVDLYFVIKYHTIIQGGIRITFIVMISLGLPHEPATVDSGRIFGRPGLARDYPTGAQSVLEFLHRLEDNQQS